jgi:hypothetical protein
LELIEKRELCYNFTYHQSKKRGKKKQKFKEIPLPQFNASIDQILMEIRDKKKKKSGPLKAGNTFALQTIRRSLADDQLSSSSASIVCKYSMVLFKDRWIFAERVWASQKVKQILTYNSYLLGLICSFWCCM